LTIKKIKSISSFPRPESLLLDLVSLIAMMLYQQRERERERERQLQQKQTVSATEMEATEFDLEVRD
jgi:hypothetical protein